MSTGGDYLAKVVNRIKIKKCVEMTEINQAGFFIQAVKHLFCQ